MAELRIFEYAVILQPLEDDDGKVKEPGELVVGLSSVLAPDQQQATILAARAIPENYIEHLDRITIAVRPF